jgi:hypothetical protein
MGILDEAIREHLQLKRQHGADDSELKKIEDQAFGPAERPGSGESASDTAAEAPTEFMAQPDADGEQPEEPSPPASVRREPAAGMADIQEPPPAPVEEEPAEEPAAEEPAEEEQPAAEHRVVPEAPLGPSTEERNAIADQPTEMYDVEEEYAPANSGQTSDEDLVAEEVSEPRLGPADPVTVPDAGEEQEEDDFFDEQRLSDELDQALEAPVEPQRAPEPEPAPPPEPEEEPEPDSEDFDLEPEEEEEEEDDDAGDQRGDEDVLEETPDFLEETPEDDQLWFEQKPPKDFDFDD